MKTYTNPIATQICSMLSPLVGDMMACGILKSQSNKIGFTEETLSFEHLTALSDGIEKGLVIFLGSDLAKQVSKKIREVKV